MITISPKSRLKERDGNDLKLIRQLAKSADFSDVLTTALAEFSVSFRPSAEQLTGVHSFLLTLLNLGEDVKEREWPASSRLLQPEEILEQAKAKR